MLLGYAKSPGRRLSQQSRTTLFVDIPKTHQMVTLVRSAALCTICYIYYFGLRISVNCYTLRTALWWMVTDLMKVEITKIEKTTITGEKSAIFTYMYWDFAVFNSAQDSP